MNTVLLPHFWLLIPLLLVIAPNAARLPFWVSLSWLIFALFSLYSAAQGRAAIGNALKSLLVLAGAAGILLHYGTLIGPAGGVALLTFLTGAKLLETTTPRDRLGLLFVGCFLLVANFLEGQSLLTAAYMVFAALVLVAGMIATQLPLSDPSAWRPPLMLAGRLLVQALPLALLLFLLFPRLHGPLWGLPQQAAARTGLSEQMRPGDISQLILSDELAFRVEFAERPPAPQFLYWRGPVLWDFDGHAWSIGRAMPGRALHALGLGEPLRYSLTLEPHGQHWLLFLGLPSRQPELPGHSSRLSADLEWRAEHPIQQRLRYEVEAYADYRLDMDLPAAVRTRGLTLPADSNPRARALASAWRQQAANDAAIVQQALHLFRTQSFFYTLNPPLLGEDAVDDFLFRSRRGFCEHYASAFVFLMRAAGLPARVVTGYQGGEINPLGNHLTVRGRDAHAWAEVWLSGQGWMRVDPTAAVAPSRVERGVAAALPAGEHPGGLLRLEGAWLRPLRIGWDMLNNQWNQWVLGYDQTRQKRFLASLSPLLAHWQSMVWALGMGAVLVIAILSAALWPRLAKNRPDAASRDYQRFCRSLARVGIARGPAEAPEDFAQRASIQRPDLIKPIQIITRLYLKSRYGPGGAAALRRLHAAVVAFRPAADSLDVKLD